MTSEMSFDEYGSRHRSGVNNCRGMPRQPILSGTIAHMNHSSKLALVALGANLPFGDLSPAKTLGAALTEMGNEGIEIVGQSRFFITPCFPAGAGPDYVNAAVSVRTEKLFDPASLLAVLHRIEKRFGRMRAQRWGMRTLDLDLLAFGQTVLPDTHSQSEWRDMAPKDQPFNTPDRLILPHPRLQDRAFVLVPLADIAPDWTHPLTGVDVRSMLDALPQAERTAVVPL